MSIQLPPLMGDSPDLWGTTLRQWRELLTREVQSIRDEIATTDTDTQIFAIWAEENAVLSGKYVWAFGDCANTPAGGGIVIGVDCELFAVGLQTGSAGTCSVAVEKNGASTGALATTSASKTGLSAVSSPVPFVAGDVLNFQTVSASGSGSPNTVTAWLRTT